MCINMRNPRRELPRGCYRWCIQERFHLSEDLKGKLDHTHNKIATKTISRIDGSASPYSASPATEDEISKLGFILQPELSVLKYIQIFYLLKTPVSKMFPT